MMTPTLKNRLRAPRLLAIGALVALTACDEAGNFTFLQPEAEGAEVTRAASAATIVERDVEAPDVFQVTEAGLWDGRPSLGGVWVAHPDVKEPERVIIRNETNGKFVIGALFRRERLAPGPELQVSSDAATALGILGGAPTLLDVTALRREKIEEPTEIEEEAGAEVMSAAAEIETTGLDADPTIAAAAAAIDAPVPAPLPIPTEDSAEPVITPAAAETRPEMPPLPASGSYLAKPFVQIGIFSVEANARRTADQMRAAGIIPTVYDQESRGKRFWRVVVGPIGTSGDRAEVLKTVKSLGFSDAYFVTN